MRRQVAAYPDIIEGRPDLDWYKSDQSTPEPGVTIAKKHPPYVHGTIGFAQLLHKVLRVEMHWYEVGAGGHHLRRLQSPRLVAHTVCGAVFYIGPRGKTCELPRPDTVMCGRCHGTGANWGRYGKNIITRAEAKLRLGCIAKGESA